MKSIIRGGLLATVLLASQAPVQAEDIDLFVQPGATAANVPNVLFMIDNTGNWTPMFTNEIMALKNIFNNLPTNADGSAKFRIGVMFATESGGANNNVNGGYVRAAIRPMTVVNKGLYATMINTLDVLKDKGNSGASGLAMAEAYRYFVGGTPYAGNNKEKTDYATSVPAGWANSVSTVASRNAATAIVVLGSNALATKAAVTYNSPIVEGSCGRNYIIYISNGANQESNSDDTTARNMLSSAGGNTTTIPISPTGSMSNPADEWTRFMETSINTLTYSIDVDPKTTGQGPGWTALLKSMAGGETTGRYVPVTTTTAAIELAISDILFKIQSVNSVYASVSLPVSVNTEGTYLNQVYIGMFRPDPDANPRWMGNLKQYKLAKVGTALKTVDAFDYPDTINPLTGFISSCARSFWTPTVMDSYWQLLPSGDCTVIPAYPGHAAEPLVNASFSNRPDGNIVEKGAAGYMLRGSTSRTVETCSSTFGSCTALIDFNTTNVTAANVDASATAAQMTAYVNWMKGLDAKDEDVDAVTDLTSPAEMRMSAHGDVVHSRPVAINYGSTDADHHVVVFYGGNDGVLRAINGNRTEAINGTAAGREMFAFVPPEFFGSVKRIYDNDITINYVGNPIVSPAPQPKPYGIDGPITVYHDSTRTWIYAGMRRGGRALYAFDVTNLATDTPAAPTLLWKRGCPNLADDTSCSANYDGIGQTWSAAKPFKASGYNTGGASPVPKPLLIMGGGYNACDDPDVNTCDSSSKGRHVYVIDAETGVRQKVFDTDRPVVADVFVIPDSSGLATWAYAVDTGGGIYRISGNSATAPIGTNAPSTWTMTKIAALGCATPATCASNRKFMFTPDVVKEGNQYVLLVGSGDREKPLRTWASTYAVTNYFFMVRDTPTDANWLSSETANCGSAVMCLDSLLPILTSANPTASALGEKKGWYLGLNDHEQVVTSAITVFGTVTFSTHVPVPVSAGCTSNLGTARVYNISYKNASSQNGTNNRSEVIAGGGLPPSPVAGMVTLDDGTTVPFLIGGDPDSPLQSLLPTGPAVGTQPKAVTYWYIHK